MGETGCVIDGTKRLSFWLMGILGMCDPPAGDDCVNSRERDRVDHVMEETF